MSLQYQQKIILGLKIPLYEIETVVQEAEWGERPIYDTYTGKVKSQEKFLIKRRIVKYSFMGLENESVYELLEEVCRQYSHFTYMIDDKNDKYFIVGIDVSALKYVTEHGMFSDELSLEELEKLFKNFQGTITFKNYEPALHIDYWVV